METCNQLWVDPEPEGRGIYDWESLVPTVVQVEPITPFIWTVVCHVQLKLWPTQLSPMEYLQCSGPSIKIAIAMNVVANSKNTVGDLQCCSGVDFLNGKKTFESWAPFNFVFFKWFEPI